MDEDAINQDAADHGLQGADDHGLADDKAKALRQRLHGRRFSTIGQRTKDGDTAVKRLVRELGAEYGEDTVSFYLPKLGRFLHEPIHFGMIECVNQDCNAYLDPDLGKFCPACGEPFEASARAAAAKAALVDCPACGETVTPGKFCEQCGAELASLP